MIRKFRHLRQHQLHRGGIGLRKARAEKAPRRAGLVVR